MNYTKVSSKGPSCVPVNHLVQAKPYHGIEMTPPIAAPASGPANLGISQSGDANEREADRVAAQIVPGSGTGQEQKPNPTVTAATPAGIAPQGDPDPELNKGSALTLPIQRLSGQGSSLPETTRALFENEFNFDFADVRIHTDTEAQQMAGSINARAFTMNNHLVFGPGQYAPDSAAGKKLLAHELTHVVQQQAAPGLASQLCRKPDSPNDDIKINIQMIPSTWIVPSHSEDFWVASDRKRLCILPPDGSIVEIRVPKEGRLPEDPVFSVPTIGKEGLRMVSTGNRTGFQIDAGGKPAIVFPEAVVAIQNALGIRSISGVALIHIHHDHVQSLLELVRQYKIRPENIYFPAAFAINRNAPGSTMARILETLSNEYKASGYGKMANYQTIPTPQTGNYFHHQIREGNVTFDFFGLTKAFQQLEKQREAGQEQPGADQASLLTKVTHGPSGLKLLVVGDLRGRDLMAFKSAMGETAYNELLKEVTVVSGLQHHLGALGEVDTKGLMDFISRTYLKTGSLTIIEQSQEHYQGSQFLNRSLIKALTDIGIDVHVALEPTAKGVGTITASSRANVSHRGDGRSEEFFGDWVIQMQVGKYLKLVEAEAVITRYQRYLQKGPEYAGQLSQARREMEELVREYIEASFRGIQATASGRSLTQLTPDAQAKQQQILAKIRNRKELEIESQVYLNGFQEELQGLKRAGPYLETYHRELEKGRKTGKLSEEGINALWEINPQLVRELLTNSGLSRMEQQRIKNQMPWRSVPLRTQAGAGFMLAVQIFTDIAPTIQAIQASNYDADIGKALTDILWWQEKQVFPNLEGLIDHWKVSDERSDQALQVIKWLYDGSLDYLALTGIADSQWGGFWAWLNSNVSNYRDWFHYFRQPYGKTVKSEGQYIDQLNWFYRKTKIEKAMIGYQVKEEWVASSQLSALMNRKAQTMVGTTNQEISQVAKGLGPKSGVNISAPGAYIPELVYADKPAARELKRFKPGIKNPLLYTLHRHKPVRGFDWTDLLYVFPTRFVAENRLTSKLPAEFVVVGGANFNTVIWFGLNQMIHRDA